MTQQDYSVRLEHVNKYYGDQHILKDINFEFEKGKFYTLLGPSGCGKTTILRLIAGFSQASSGKVYLGGECVNDRDPSHRQVNTVFQDYSLFPHMNVFDNIAFGLRIKKVAEKDIQARVTEALRLVQLPNFAQREIADMSGGQRQRIAIARAIVNEPEVLLLDEPLSALDYKLRTKMQYELRTLQDRLGITFIFVTHDQEEALRMSDEIIVMSEGEIVQSGLPNDIYDEPINRYVAEFIGESNIIEGRMVRDFEVEMFNHVFACEDGGIPANEAVEVVIRPEDILLSAPEAGQVQVRVETVLYTGVFNEVIAKDRYQNQWKIHTTQKIEEGQDLGLRIEADAIHVMRFNESEEDFDNRLELYEEVDSHDQ